MEDGNFPSAPASRYMHEEAMGKKDLRRLDESNRAHLGDYVANVHKMEAITRYTRSKGTIWPLA
eukprot:COSAG02_NODE_1898_length_10461_cov_3.844528_11_plen_64_part_00